MNNRLCFHCSKEITDPLDYNLYPLDIPYINLFFHKSCFRELGGYDKMPEYVTQSVERVLKFKKGIDNEQKRKTTKV
jgi:hypothetical protein